jgi:integrase
MTRIDFQLSPEQRMDARAALRILDGTEISLEQAARQAVQGKRAVSRIRFSDAVDQFIVSRIDSGLRSVTVGWYQKMLKDPEAKFGDRWFDEIPRAELFTWLKDLAIGEHSKAGMSRALRALWRWGVTHEPQLVAVDITLGLRRTGPRNEGDAKFLTVDQVAKVMAEAGPYRNTFALLFFGAVRPEEIAGDGKPRMLWKHVRTDEKTIRVSGDIAKTTKPRIIQALPDTVWHWLTPGKDNEPICKAHVRQATRRAKEILGFWFHDATRHTCATHFLAYTGDAGKVSTWLGHEGKPSLLHRDYAGLATKPEGEKFVALRPMSGEPL